jgi:hypothetical protein
MHHSRLAPGFPAKQVLSRGRDLGAAARRTRRRRHWRASRNVMTARTRRWSSPVSGMRSFIKILRTCFSAVPPVTQSFRAIPAFDRPPAMSASTSRFRGKARQAGRLRAGRRLGARLSRTACAAGDRRHSRAGSGRPVCLCIVSAGRDRPHISVSRVMRPGSPHVIESLPSQTGGPVCQPGRGAPRQGPGLRPAAGHRSAAGRQHGGAAGVQGRQAAHRARSGPGAFHKRAAGWLPCGDRGMTLDLYSPDSPAQ